jgi:hypothetical protein
MENAPAMIPPAMAATTPVSGVPSRWRRLANRFELNPMMFKELTQGVRNRAFLSLFFSLMSCGLLTVILGASWGDAASGPWVFGFLVIGLHVYGTALGVRALLLTTGEMENKTFDLYTLAGMTPEKMARGKLFTMWYAYFFGLSCLAPFMLSSYFMGGLDFLSIFAVLGCVTLAHLYYYMICSLAAMARGLSKSRTLILVGYGLGVLFFGFMGIGGISEYAFDNSGRELLEIKGLQWVGFSFYTLAYILTYFGMFYISCQLMCPETDTREHVLRGLATIGWLALLGVYMAMEISGDSSFGEWLAVYWLCFLAFGLVFWINREDMPIIVRNQWRGYKGWQRATLWLLEPGRRGAARHMVILWAVAIIALLCWEILGLQSSKRLYSYATYSAWKAVLLPITIMYFLVISDWLARQVRVIGAKPATRRVAVGAAWALIALAMILGLTFAQGGNLDPTQDPMIHGAGIFLTPMLTLYAFWGDGATKVIPLILCIHLPIALMGLWFDSARIRRDQEEFKQFFAPVPPPSSQAAPAPSPAAPEPAAEG